MSDPNHFSVLELKDVLRRYKLPTSGAKAELIARLMEADPTGTWMHESGGSGGDERDDDDEDLLPRREIEICRREKEIAERELELARREIEILKSEAAASRDRGSGLPVRGDENAAVVVSRVQSWRPDLAGLLGDFDGVSGIFDTWEKQLRFLKTTYRLEDDHTKILIGSKIKKKAYEWFHSKPEYMSMPFEELIGEMREMFQRRESKASLRKKFESRTWKKDETFHEYVHEKTIMGNRVPVDRDEMLEYTIDGIPDTALRDQARVQGFVTMDSLLKAFEKVSLRNRDEAASGRRSGRIGGATRNEGSERRGGGGAADSDGKKSETKRATNNTKRCYNCGAREHVSANCPKRELGTKCFECGEYGHIAAKCQKKNVDVKGAAISAVSRVFRKKCVKEVTIDGRITTALIDTGSDISIMRASEHKMIGLPGLQPSKVEFCGIGSYSVASLGQVRTEITIDGHVYSMLIHVVPDTVLHYGLLIGTDFLDTVEINIKQGVISIEPIPGEVTDDGMRPEIFAINTVRDTNKIDVSCIENAEHRQAVTDLVAKYEPNKLREFDVRMTIVLKDDEPVYQKARRLPQVERDVVNAQIRDWEEQGIVRPSNSEFASPIVLVGKKDGSRRLCVDYRMLNKKIIRDRYPLPLIEDQLDQLQGAKIFSTLDLKNGFFHVRMDESSIKYTSFVVPDGQYEFLRVPFGLCNSPSVFQRFINAVFRELVGKGIVLIYMDDLIVLSNDETTGLKNLRIVLEVAGQAGLSINWKKCCFLQRKVEFLGHIVEDGTIRPSERKVKAVMCFPEPQNIRQVQAFLGLSGYFRKFIREYSRIARPLSNLLRANAVYQFGDIEKNAFRQLKIALSERPVLHLYRPGAETELHTDASKHGYGAILLQRNAEDQFLHPVYYASGKTTPAEERYTSYELEVLAIVRALKRFRVYLLGIPFKIVTDCRAFSQTMSKRDLCVRVARWALLLEEFKYSIEHRPGKNMAHVDALSRNPLPLCLIVSECEQGLMARLREAQKKDADLGKIFEALARGEASGYAIKGGVLYKEIDDDMRVVVPGGMQTKIIEKAHEQGHFGANKTEALIKNDYWIPNLRSKIEKIIQNCVACVLAERKHGKSECLLHPIEKGSVPLDTFHIDHLGPLPSTKKSYAHILVVIDAFSKFTWLYAVKSTSTVETINRLTKQSFIFGNPRRIISDRGSGFTSKEFEEYCRSEGIDHILTTTGIPRSNGQVERVNRALIPLLTKLAAPKHCEWYKYLVIAQLYLNTTLHRSIKTAPFRVLFGVHPRIRDNPNIKEILENEILTSFDDSRQELRSQARENILKIQDENKRNYNKKRKKAFCYREGDLVAIKRTQQGPGLKLAHKYLGPYEIIKTLRNDRYILRKIGEHEGPLQTSSAADVMKPWINDDNTDDEISDDDSKNG